MPYRGSLAFEDAEFHPLTVVSWIVDASGVWFRLEGFEEGADYWVDGRAERVSEGRYVALDLPCQSHDAPGETRVDIVLTRLVATADCCEVVGEWWEGDAGMPKLGYRFDGELEPFAG